MILRKVVPIIIIIGNDENTNIATVNLLTKQLIYTLKKHSLELAEEQFAFAILSSSNGGKWITGKKIIEEDEFCMSEEERTQRCEEIIKQKNLPFLLRVGACDIANEENIFVWQDLDISNKCNLADLFCVLNDGLSSKEILASPFSILAPHLILFYCGSPSYNYRNALEKLRQNNWFKHSKKIAIAYSDDTDRDVLREFTENSETVFNTNDSELLKKVFNKTISEIN